MSLGECHDQTPGLPKDVGPYDVTYGVPVIKDCTAGELVNPAKSRTEVQSEAVEGQEIYKVSHGAYDVGK